MTAIRDLIREAIAQAGDEPDLDEVTKHVINQLTEDAIREAIFPLVRQDVLNVLHLQRTVGFVDEPDEDAVVETPRVGPSRIARGVAARDRFLGMVVCIDETAGLHKRLLACSLSDVMQIVRNRETRASHFQAEANRFKHLAEVMAAEQAPTPADISPAALEALILGWRS